MQTLGKTLLVGAGNMGREYCKVLKAMGVDFSVITRGEEKAKKLSSDYDVEVITGGVQENESLIGSFDNAIVAVNGIYLAQITNLLINQGIKNIMVEKPMGLTREEIENVHKNALSKGTNLYVAYNRRFYSSTFAADDIIKSDGRILSVNFEFTEWGSIISKLNVPKLELYTNLLGNSSHPIDLALYFAGDPVTMSSYIGGGVDWHPNGSIYAGAGYTDKGVMFSYNANWEAPGRWGVEVLTPKHRLYFRPMEKLFMQDMDSVNINEVQIDDKLDRVFKPGVFREVEAFLKKKNTERLLSSQQQLNNLRVYEMIAGVAGEYIRI